VATGQLIKAEIRPGMQIGIDGQGGTVEQVGTIYTTIRTQSGQMKVPNAALARQTIMVASDQGGAKPQR